MSIDYRIMLTAQRKSWKRTVDVADQLVDVRGRRMTRKCTCAGQNWQGTKRCHCSISKLELEMNGDIYW